MEQKSKELTIKWKLINAKSEDGRLLGCEDHSIYTIAGDEVLGCSEWLRCEYETLKHIVDLHNKNLTKLQNKAIIRNFLK
jgi:hypothetical protein